MVKVSVIWLNYNSMPIVNVVLNSLSTFLELNYDNYEFILVDNASTDGSFEVITRHIERHKPASQRVKIIRNSQNLGFAGGMNVGWEARDPDSKYVVFANNDFIADPDSLTKIIEFIDNERNIAAANGLIYRPDKRISTAGLAVDDILTELPICGGLQLADCPTATKPYPITFVDCSYCIVKADLVRRFGFNGFPFINETFLYADDILLSIKLWNHSFSSYYVPVEAGIHYSGMTTKRTGMVNYYALRGKFIRHAMIEKPYDNLSTIYYHRLKLTSKLLCKVGYRQYCTFYKAVTDGLKIGYELRKRFGRLQLKKAPRVKLRGYIPLMRLFLPVRSLFMSKRIILHSDLVL